MKINKIEMYQIQLPLKFQFKTSQAALTNRETLIIRVIDTMGRVGYGEVVSFKKPFYTEETIAISKRVLTTDYIPIVLRNEFSHPFAIHKRISPKYPMALAGIENAMSDLYAKSQGKSIMETVFNEPTNKRIDGGIAISNDSGSKMKTEIQNGIQMGYTRFKLKISPKDDLDKIAYIRKVFPDLMLFVDANRSFNLDDPRLRELDKLNLMCIEEPSKINNFAELSELQKELRTPICLDESIQTIEQLDHAIEAKALKVLNLKVGRVGGLYYVKEMINRCREHQINYWIGSMVESGVSKILHVHLSSLSDIYMPGDLSASNRYFANDLIEPEIQVRNGHIEVPVGPGLGVNINHQILKKMSIDVQEFRRADYELN